LYYIYEINYEPFFTWLVQGARIGKIYVILTFLTLAWSWQQSNFIMVVVHMRIASMNVEGHTIYVILNFNHNEKP
jgi:hypothetical protein